MGGRGTRISAAQSSTRRRTRGSSASVSSTCSSIPSQQSRLSISHSSSASSSAPSTPEPVTEHDNAQYTTAPETMPTPERSINDDIHGVIVNTNTHSAFSPFVPSDSPCAENQLFNLFMNNTFCEPSTSFADYTSPFEVYDTPRAFSDVDPIDPFSTWTNSVPESAPAEQISFSNPPATYSHHGSPRLASQTRLNDVAGQQMDVIPAGVEYFTSNPPMTTSPQPSRYSSPTVHEFPSGLTDAQVTISSIPSMPDRASIQVTQPTADPSDRRVAVAVAICDRQDIGSTVQSLSQSLSAILCHPPSPASQ